MANTYRKKRIQGETQAMKITKILAAIAAAAAVLSFAGCSNNNTSSSSAADSSSAAESTASTAEAASATAETDSKASTAEVVAAAPTAEASAFDVTAMYGNWILAGINNGTETLSVADYADSIGAAAEDCLVVIAIDENGYTTATSGAESTFAYTVSDNGIAVDLGEGAILNVVYDADTNGLYYAASDADGNVLKFVFMNADEETAATAQASATAEAAE